MSMVEMMEANVKVSRQRACKEVKWHGVSIERFFAEFGIHDEYSAKELLAWLGY